MPNIYNSSVVVLGGGAEIPVDNGAIYEGKYRVRYIDIDGTVLKIEYVENGGRTTPPNNPSYDPDYLIFDEWNYDIENYIVNEPTDIGATYKTVDDATYIFIKVLTAFDINISNNFSNYTSIDWGDGTIDTSTTHSYSQKGFYVIKIYGNITITADASSGKYWLYNDYRWNNNIIKIYLKKGITDVPNFCFQSIYSLSVVSIPSGFNTSHYALFERCPSLKCLILPKSQIHENTLIRTISNCRSLRYFSASKELTKIGDSFFREVAGINDFIIPKAITSIAANVFYLGCCIQNIFVYCETVPTLTNVNAFTSLPNPIFWVNDDIIENLKVATNWSTFANQMIPLSWYPNLTDPNA